MSTPRKASEAGLVGVECAWEEGILSAGVADALGMACFQLSVAQLDLGVTRRRMATAQRE